jgi:hypothetical protein
MLVLQKYQTHYTSSLSDAKSVQTLECSITNAGYSITAGSWNRSWGATLALAAARCAPNWRVHWHDTMVHASFQEAGCAPVVLLWPCNLGVWISKALPPVRTPASHTAQHRAAQRSSDNKKNQSTVPARMQSSTMHAQQQETSNNGILTRQVGPAGFCPQRSSGRWMPQPLTAPLQTALC